MQFIIFDTNILETELRTNIKLAESRKFLFFYEIKEKLKLIWCLIDELMPMTSTIAMAKG